MTLTFRQRLGFRAEHRIADRMAPDLKRGLLAAIADLRADIPFLRVFFERLDTARSVDALPWRDLELGLLGRFRAVFREAVERSMTAQVETIPSVRKADDPPTVTFSLNLTNPRAQQWIDRHAAELVVEVSEETKLAIRDQLRQMFAQGIPADEIARRIRPLIGLTRRDAAAVAKLRARLELENTKRLAEQRKPWPEERINAPVDAYAGRLLRGRAERIARTESIRASAEGQQELWRQATDAGFLDKERTRRAWLITPDERLCEICAPMADDKALVNLEQPFGLPNGETVMTPPGHPMCRCATGLVFPDEAGNFRHPQA